MIDNYLYEGVCIHSGKKVRGVLIESLGLLKPHSLFIAPELQSLRYHSDNRTYELGGFHEVDPATVHKVNK